MPWVASVCGTMFTGTTYVVEASWGSGERIVAGHLTPGSWHVRSATIPGAPASPGIASDPVRLVRGPADFPKVQPGDVLVCRNTDPAWTPLFAIASAVVTESDGVLSHAAIVAREAGILAVLAVPRATTVLIPSSTIKDNTGHVSLREQP